MTQERVDQELEQSPKASSDSTQKTSSPGMRTPQFPNNSPSLACRTLLKTAEQFEELFALKATVGAEPKDDAEATVVEADVARQCEDFRKARLAVAEMVAEALNSAEARQKSSARRLSHSPSAPSLRPKVMLPRAALPRSVPRKVRKELGSPSGSGRPCGSLARTPSRSKERLKSRMARVDQLTPRSGSRSVTPRSRQEPRSPPAEQEQLAAQERSPKAKQQVMKTMGLSDEEYARCKGSLAAQAALLLQRREQARAASQERQRPSARRPSVPRHRVKAASSFEEKPREVSPSLLAHEKARQEATKLTKCADDVLLGCPRELETTEEVCLGGEEAKERDEDTDTVPMPGFTLHVSRLPAEATDASLRKMCQCFGVQVMRVRRPTIFDAEVLLGPLAEPERSRRTHLLADFLQNRAGCQVSVCGGGF